MVVSLEGLDFAEGIRQQIEKPRVGAQTRQAHLKKAGKVDPFLEEILPELKNLEDQIEKVMQQRILLHPVWLNWGKHVKGVGPMLLSAIMANCYIDRCSTPSSFWAHYGMAPGQKRVKGEKIDYSPRGRVLCWRLGTQFQKLRRHDPAFLRIYDQRKEYEIRKVDLQGGKVIPAKKGVKVLPPDKTVLQVHMYSMRYMLKIFLNMLWLVWREAEGLPVTEPYHLVHPGEDGRVHGAGHTYFTPEQFIQKKSHSSKVTHQP